MNTSSTQSILKTYLTACVQVEQEFDDLPLELLQGHGAPIIERVSLPQRAGRLVHQGVQYQHLFDGDGMISRFHFQDGQVYYRNRYVRTQEFVREEEARKMLYRSFGTNIPGGWAKNFLRTRFKNAANTSVVYHGNKLLALWEGGLPHKIDPQTLDTQGRYHYDGKLRNPASWLERMITPELAFSAHPKIHPQSGELFNFGTQAGRHPKLVHYRVKADGEAEVPTFTPMPYLSFVHDFVLTTPNQYRIFFLTPVSFDIFKTFFGIKTPVESIRARKGENTQIQVMNDRQSFSLDSDYCYIFHFANGYEKNDREIVIDALRMEDFS
ncbi:MAG: carotenoid oxygenase family protein, partial [Bacteroidia bacterium]|nr:carotenoid oxygenase family protein [Bacteroidia bacterium]